MENLPVDYFVTSAAFTKTTYRDVYPAIDPTSDSNSQAGKVIVITGASKGIGRLGFAASFAKAGPKGIVLVSRSADSLYVVAKEIHAINNKIEVLSVPTDVSDIQSVSQLWDKVKETFGHADVLVNNAGTLNAGTIATADPKAWWTDFEANVQGTFLVTQGFLKLLGPEKKGSIINMTTGIAVGVAPGMSSYALSKLVALQIQAFVAAENPNVTAVSLNPGVVLTDMTMDSFKRFALDTPELVGGTAVWLATEQASFLTGKYVCANWSMDDLSARKDEITSEGKLSIALVGKFGQEQFQ